MCRKDYDQEFQEKIDIHVVQKSQSQVILSTAQVLIEDVNGERFISKALLDPGSQTNVITSALASKLRLVPIKTSQIVSGINETKANYTEMVRTKLRSLHTKFETEIEFIVMTTITDKLPQIQFDKNWIRIPKNVVLADSAFNEPSNIDLLLGAGIFWRIISKESAPKKKGMPRLQKTLLGWIVGGELQITGCSTNNKICGILTDTPLKDQLERFWKLEEISERRQ